MIDIIAMIAIMFRKQHQDGTIIDAASTMLRMTLYNTAFTRHAHDVILSTTHMKDCDDISLTANIVLTTCANSPPWTTKNKHCNTSEGENNAKPPPECGHPC